MFYIARPCSTRISTLKSVIYIFFVHESSIRFGFFSVFTLRHNRPIVVKKQAYTIVGGKFRENKRVSLKKPVYNVRLH